MEFYHRPVLLKECLDGLAVRPDGIYVDGTLGGGGHSSEIIARLSSGRLIGIDRDMDAIRAASARIQKITSQSGARFEALHGNFHDAAALLSAIDVDRVSGVLLDLGVSSYQLDESARGFSYHTDAPLDMRMDRSQSVTARSIVNEWSEEELARIFREYGEENWAVQIARVICDRRKKTSIETTGQLVNIIDAAIPKKVRAQGGGAHPARRTFQALRIAVNDELVPLEQALRDIVKVLEPGGRLCVIAFHSLEDRVVKTTFKNLADPCICPKSFPICICGKRPEVKLITRKPITASEEELSENPRARSATLRIVEKI